MVDWLADYFEHVGDYPVTPPVTPGEILSHLPDTPPRDGEDMDTILRDYREIILPGMSHWQHPGWFAYFPANNSPPSVLAEILTAGLGAQCMSWITSPAATELEERMMEWLRDMIGLPAHMSGVIQDTASTATLCALLSARERATDFTTNDRGMHAGLTVYASTQTHSSIEKGVRIAGFGKHHLRLVAVDDAYAMNPEALRKAIVEDMERGKKPACVVATLGTTSSMAMDPLEPISAICREYGIWLHVDAAFAGTAAIHPGHRWFMKGVEACDSFVFNPHKWMLTNFDCSAYFVRDPDTLLQTLSMDPEYLKTSADKQVKNYRDWGIQLGRRFRALKLWFVIRSYGVRGIADMVDRHIGMARDFAAWLEADERFELLAPRQLSLVCFRYKQDQLPEEELDRLNRRLLDTINASGKVFMSHTQLGGRFCLRLSVGQATTSEEHLQQAWQIISEAAGAL